MEENRRFSLSDLLIKIIIIIIFVLFTIWLLSLGNKGMTNSLDVLTNNIFSQNIEKMKNVGKDYFTTERLPKKVGEIETLTLEEMYEKKLILTLTDKSGKKCSAEDSYVSVEKFDDEYQMKVYLECGEEKDYIIVIMGCYDYCDTDICEKVETENKKIEYQYSKLIGVYWTDYGNWSEWSKVILTSNDYRQVETKVEKEQYSYDKTITEIVYEDMIATCESGYTRNGNSCVKEVTTTERENPICPVISGYNYVGRDGFTCKYTKKITDTKVEYITKDATCSSGYTRDGYVCIKYTTLTTNPVCSAKDGYTVSRNGFTCTYTKNVVSSTINPTCPKVDGYTMYERDGFTCNYSKYIKGDYVGMDSGENVPKNTNKYIYEEVGAAKYVYDCENTCAMKWIHTWEIYKANSSNIKKDATCPVGYTANGDVCVKGSVETLTETATCPSEYVKSGNTCSKTATTTKNPVCSTVSGYDYIGRDGFTCNYSKTISSDIIDTITENATCPVGFNKSSTDCYQTSTVVLESDLVNSCPSGYKETDDGSRCYKEVEKTITVTDTKEVTYYRYRVREYKDGKIDYKWSYSKNDKTLINAGYKLTGKTR